MQTFSLLPFCSIWMEKFNSSQPFAQPLLQEGRLQQGKEFSFINNLRSWYRLWLQNFFSG